METARHFAVDNTGADIALAGIFGRLQGQVT